jgi:acyl carrier protein
MNTDDIYKRLQGIFDNVFMEEVRVTPELSANDVDEWDSVTHVSLVLAVEEEFGLRFRVGEVESAKNLGDLVNLIARRTK